MFWKQSESLCCSCCTCILAYLHTSIQSNTSSPYRNQGKSMSGDRFCWTLQKDSGEEACVES